MKHFRSLLPLLILALVLSACAGTAREPYTYTSGGATVTVDPVNGTITNGREVFTYTIEDQGSRTGTASFSPMEASITGLWRSTAAPAAGARILILAAGTMPTSWWMP